MRSVSSRARLLKFHDKNIKELKKKIEDTEADIEKMRASIFTTIVGTFAVQAQLLSAVFFVKANMHKAPLLRFIAIPISLSLLSLFGCSGLVVLCNINRARHFVDNVFNVLLEHLG